MPVERRRSAAHTGRSMIVALIAVILALATVFGVAWLTSRGDVELSIGHDRFRAGRAEDILDRIQRDDGPIGFEDVASGARPIWIDNAGDDPETGWIVVGAFLPDDPSCAVNWSAESAEYVAACDETITFPRSGAGLRHYVATVVDARLEVNLRDQE